jgi:predicted ATPase
MVLWTLGYPEAALADADGAVRDGRQIGQAASLMFALLHSSPTYMYCGQYAVANANLDETIARADERGALFWKAHGMMHKACALTMAGKPSEAVQIGTAGIAAYRSTGSTGWMPWYLSNLAAAHAALDELDHAWRCIGEATTAIEVAEERWWEAEVLTVAGEVALKPPTPDASKAEAYFARALAVARAQRARSLELRAATSMARLYSNQGKGAAARELLAPVYAWFGEGFDAADQKRARALLDLL